MACHRDWRDDHAGDERKCSHIYDGPDLDEWDSRRSISPDERRAHAIRSELWYRGSNEGAFLDQPHPFALSYFSEARYALLRPLYQNGPD